MIYAVIAIALILLFIWFLYNGLITARLRVNEALSQIDVQLKRRADLIPNLIETVKGYAKHEKELFEKVTKERSALVSAKGMHDKAEANNQLSQTLKSIFAVAESYPDLKASQNFQNFKVSYLIRRIKLRTQGNFIIQACLILIQNSNFPTFSLQSF